VGKVEVKESNSRGRMFFIQYLLKKRRFQVGRDRRKEGRNDDEMKKPNQLPTKNAPVFNSTSKAIT
jgi:hypothetical protein